MGIPSKYNIPPITPSGFRKVSSNTTLRATDKVVFVDATENVTLILPDPSVLSPEKSQTVNNVRDGLVTVTLEPPGGVAINGSTSFTVFAGTTIYTDGVSYYTLDYKIKDDWVREDGKLVSTTPMVAESLDLSDTLSIGDTLLDSTGIRVMDISSTDITTSRLFVGYPLDVTGDEVLIFERTILNDSSIVVTGYAQTYEMLNAVDGSELVVTREYILHDGMLKLYTSTKVYSAEPSDHESPAPGCIVFADRATQNPLSKPSGGAYKVMYKGASGQGELTDQLD